jgi:hypothetical protein
MISISPNAVPFARGTPKVATPVVADEERIF